HSEIQAREFLFEGLCGCFLLSIRPYGRYIWFRDGRHLDAIQRVRSWSQNRGEHLCYSQTIDPDQIGHRHRGPFKSSFGDRFDFPMLLQNPERVSKSTPKATPRILLVDIDSDLRQNVTRLLAAHYGIDAAADVPTAFSLARETTPDL